MRRPAIGTGSPLPAEQWSAGIGRTPARSTGIPSHRNDDGRHNPLPAGVGPVEAALQEQLYAAGHPHPLAEAARRVDALVPPSVLAAVRCTSAQRTSHAEHVTTARNWLYAHTAQPSGDPWNDNPELLDQAAADLAHTLTGGTP